MLRLLIQEDGKRDEKGCGEWERFNPNVCTINCELYTMSPLFMAKSWLI